ncbi:LacI family DNA-binding transcriptional regulator [Rhizomonospora bruguierae]|uniref:LacI family DNA-binding transcriptional regulator n=1 Tax=Rhizomonospora bruguierae TaxID=1581705 RepID=UPI001BCE1BB3|nr:LacI family DNA-binding transcriptional regulator [Micromonospora sp. NBRC 107566]
MPKVTSFDVARLAGVSQPTVSRALRDLPSVSPQTKERVRAAARQLAYIPHDQGRALSTRTTRRVAVVSEALTNPFYPQLLEPLRGALERNGYATVVVTDGDGDLAGEVLADGSFDGVVLTTARRGSTVARELARRAVPHVLANRVLDEPESPSVAMDNPAGGAAVGRFVATLGHRRIASIEGPDDTSTGRDRALGLRRGLREHGLRIHAGLVRQVPFDHDSGRAATRELLQRDEPPTAIVCGNDVLAFGALSAARELGVDVPGALTVVGFDDIALSSWPVINLTTVHCDLDALGRRAVDLLLAQLRGGRVAGHDVLAPTLVLRGTHGPPA